MAASKTTTHDDVKEYYGNRVKASTDLQTNVCYVSRKDLLQQAKEAMKLIHPDVLAKNYGCGVVFPECIEGCNILDLGSGAGIDCFVLSKIVGQNGRVVGVDMTTEQVEAARQYISYHTEQFGYSEPNVDFKQGLIERLDLVGLQDNTFDVVVSNCVVNLTPDKKAVLKEAYRVLKPGGEVYFSDIYTDRPMPEDLKSNKVLWGECLSGALQWKELMEIATEVGFAPPILVSSSAIAINNPEIEQLRVAAGGIQFCSATYRLFKLPVDPLTESEQLMEVKYKGTIQGHPASVSFFHFGAISSHSGIIVPASVANVILHSRLATHFTVQPVSAGDKVEAACPSLSLFLEVDPFKACIDGSKSTVGSCCC